MTTLVQYDAMCSQFVSKLLESCRYKVVICQ